MKKNIGLMCAGVFLFLLILSQQLVDMKVLMMQKCVDLPCLMGHIETIKDAEGNARYYNVDRLRIFKLDQEGISIMRNYAMTKWEDLPLEPLALKHLVEESDLETMCDELAGSVTNVCEIAKEGSGFWFYKRSGGLELSRNMEEIVKRYNPENKTNYQHRGYDLYVFDQNTGVLYYAYASNW